MTLKAMLGDRWVVQGVFTVPEPVDARLEAEGLVSGAAVLSVALYDPVLVQGSQITITATTPGSTYKSQVISLVPNKSYQIAIKVSGEENAVNQATSRTVHLVDP
jgi:hypothetical protein